MTDDWNWVGPDCHRIELMDWRIGNGLIQIANRLALGWRWVDLDWHRIDHGLVLDWVWIAIGSAMDWEKWNELANLSRIGGLVTNRHEKVRLVDWLDLCRIVGGLT